MNIKQVVTETALHMPGVGTLPVTIIVGKGTKYPSGSIKLLDGNSVLLKIGAVSAIIPATQIKTIIVDDASNS